MKINNFMPFVFGFFFYILSSSYAQSGVDNNERRCDGATLELIATEFGLSHFFYHGNDESASEELAGNIISGVCKSWPTDKSRTIAGFIYDADVAGEKALMLAVVDVAKGHVVASYQSTVPEDGATRIADYSLKLDTAAYILSKNTRAFSIRLDTFFERCTYDGGYNNVLTLFVIDGKQLRPVLSDLNMSEWSYESGNRCGGEEVARKEVNLAIAIAPTKSHGFADLFITAKNNDGQLLYSGRVRYDGKTYNLKKWH